MSDGRRYGIIAFVVLLMAAGVFVVGELVRGPAPGAGESPPDPATDPEVLGLQEGQFEGLGDPLWPEGRTGQLAWNDTGRTLAEREALRAFPGAPPSIPHPVIAEMTTGRACLACHEHGGLAPQFDAYAPVTPHPQLVACQQCHVARTTEETFVANDFQARPAPATGGAALPGSPPPVPHSLAMRGTCVACHAGPSVPAELRTTHPERAGCLQCHVPQEAGAGAVWTRQASFAGEAP